MTPDIVIHADWSTDISKRVLARAERVADRYVVTEIDLVGRFPHSLIDFRLKEPHNQAKTRLVGFDVPFGIPIPYAKRIGCERFSELLGQLGHAAWEAFYEPAATVDDISLQRPFYPAKPGGKSRQQLIDGLGLSSGEDLMRVCDRATDKRPAGSPLFWTLGAKQVGKAAISVWRDVVGPMIQDRSLDVALWPFDGKLPELILGHQIVVAEVYPAEMYHHLQLEFAKRESKRRHTDRLSKASKLLAFAESNRIEFLPHLKRDIQDGFGDVAIGEDAFDACVGMLGMLGVLMGKFPVGEPENDTIRRIEGSILGFESGPVLKTGPL